MSDFMLNDSDSGVDSDEELQEAFAKGLLKPGLNEVIEKEAKLYANDVEGLKQSLKCLKLKLPWIETLDLITATAPIAPDVALQMQETAIRRKNIKENSKGNRLYDPAQDPVLNEFKRENLIHRLAQSAVIEGMGRLKTMGISTKRPDDYFAEMAKSDGHMQKVRKNLLAKQAGQARAEKVRQLRDQKKIAKKVQIEAKLKQVADKKQMLDKLKRVRKGTSSDLGFLDDNPNSKNYGNQNNNDKQTNKKRAMKDKKFGFGGKKRGMKTNTRDSTNDMSSFNSSSKQKKKDFKSFKGNNNKGAGGGGKKQRPGKSRRMNKKK